MSHIDHRRFDSALAQIDRAILPNLSRLLDGVLESSALARPGMDAEAYAAALRQSARQMEQLARLVGLVAQPARNISA